MKDVFEQIHVPGNTQNNDKPVHYYKDVLFIICKKVMIISVLIHFPHYLRLFPRYTDTVDVTFVHDIRVQQHQGTEEERQEE